MDAIKLQRRMKSIKEKSLEVFPCHCNAYTDASNKDKRIGFEAGANYVLEQIEKCVKSSSNSRLKIDTIKQIIEQLKK